LTLEYGGHRATLLPQVWQQLPEARDFLAALKIKAGLPEDFWSANVIVSRYGVVTWKEQDPSVLVQ
jgi:AMMECR1 domain-containing protein